MPPKPGWLTKSAAVSQLFYKPAFDGWLGLIFCRVFSANWVFDTFSCFHGEKLLAVIRVSMTSGKLEKIYFDGAAVLAFVLTMLMLYAMVKTCVQRDQAVQALR